MSKGMDNDLDLRARRSAEDDVGDDHGGRGRGRDDDTNDDRGGRGRGRDDEGEDDRGGRGRGRDDDTNDDHGGGRGRGRGGDDDDDQGGHGRGRDDDRSDDVIDSQATSETLTGGRGDDTFVFDTALGLDNVDHITDFNRGHDVIKLDSDIFTGLELGVLERSAFKDIKSHDVDADDRILYNHKTGELFFDVDGAGGAEAVHFATLDHDPSLKARDFLVE